MARSLRNRGGYFTMERKDEILDKILSVEVLDAMADWVKVVNIKGKIL